MYRRLRILVPAIQVLLVVAVYALPKFMSIYKKLFLESAVYFTQDLIDKMNFPLVAIWSPILLAADKLSSYFPPLTGLIFVVAAITFSGLVLSSVAVFWYFFVTEIEMRRRGKSMLMLSRLPKQLSVTVVLLLFGVGALIYAYTSAVRPSGHLNINEDKIPGGVILFAWGIALIGIAVHDLRKFLRERVTLPVTTDTR
jgi:hypothetical protein